METLYPKLFTEFPEVMTAQDVARYLDISLNTMYSLLKKRKIRGRKIGKKWTVSRTKLIEYIER